MLGSFVLSGGGGYVKKNQPFKDCCVYVSIMVFLFWMSSNHTTGALMFKQRL